MRTDIVNLQLSANDDNDDNTLTLFLQFTANLDDVDTQIDYVAVLKNRLFRIGIGLSVENITQVDLFDGPVIKCHHTGPGIKSSWN